MKKLFCLAGVLTLAIVWATGVEVRQAPPEPNCTLDPELCTKK